MKLNRIFYFEGRISTDIAKFTKVSLLRERVKSNMAHLKDEVMKQDKDSVYELSAMITAAGTVYDYLINKDWISLKEAEYLLKYDNPLLMLTLAWLQTAEASYGELSVMLGELARSGRILSLESTRTEARQYEEYRDELDEEDVDVIFIVSELIDLCHKYLNVVKCERYENEGKDSWDGD